MVVAGPVLELDGIARRKDTIQQEGQQQQEQHLRNVLTWCDFNMEGIHQMQLLPFWSFSNFNPGKPVNKEKANENPSNNPNRFWPLFIDVVVWDRWLFFVQRLNVH